jgi:hypothetical protein
LWKTSRVEGCLACLQVAMFDANQTPPADEVVAFAERARAALGG